ncbi:hypothetical protein IFM89_009813 [Coptis chinensis]|uniref:AIR9-like A9 domain-containing protein n=1 Tax=Coptis chinensis TaxID=261450 RepID=A0A835I1P0_9MAGN|nr:hypothetical protein IFM89_009813 [Coptis chinensis]
MSELSSITAAPPSVTSLKIIGDLREGSKVTVTAIVSGGTEGSSRVQWFKTSSSNLVAENFLEPLSSSEIAKVFHIPLGGVGHYIVAKFTPMAPDGESGEPAFLISEMAVQTLPPSLNFLSVTGDYVEGEILRASYGYIGGHEGNCLYNWYIHKSEDDSGALVPEASGCLQYRIRKDAVGKFISFGCTLVRDDGAVGDPWTSFGPERIVRITFSMIFIGMNSSSGKCSCTACFPFLHPYCHCDAANVPPAEVVLCHCSLNTCSITGVLMVGCGLKSVSSDLVHDFFFSLFFFARRSSHIHFPSLNAPEPGCWDSNRLCDRSRHLLSILQGLRCGCGRFVCTVPLFPIAANLMRDLSPPKTGKFVPLPKIGSSVLGGANFATNICVGSLAVIVLAQTQQQEGWSDYSRCWCWL